MQSILIFGRQPELGLAEIESLYGANNLLPLDGGCAVVNIDPCNLNFRRLGGSIKLAKLLVDLPSTEWAEIEKFLLENSPQHVKDMPPGKMNLGISAYNFTVSPKQVTTTAIKLKKAIIKSGRNVRVVPNKEIALNSASVTHNKLTKETGWELLLIKSGNKTYVGQTILVQDIKSYASRDQTRPDRNPRVGMLPPKLAQIIINLASKQIIIDENQDACEPMKLEYKKIVLDPFCGSGVILQEALLMGFNVIGCDIDKKMLDSSVNNIDWLRKKFSLSPNAKTTFSVTDALSAKWADFDFVATETSLGKPLSSLPSHQEMQEIIAKSDNMIAAFLKNLSEQTKSGSKHCIAVPAWQIDKNKFLHLPMIDRLEELGYNSVDFKHLKGVKQLLYYRPEQIVARQLLVIVRK